MLAERVGTPQLDFGLEKSRRRKSQRPRQVARANSVAAPRSLAPLPFGWSPGSYREFRWILGKGHWRWLGQGVMNLAGKTLCSGGDSRFLALLLDL